MEEEKRLQSVLVSVKSGGVTSSQVRDLKGTAEREKAALGLFLTLDEPTRSMRQAPRSSSGSIGVFRGAGHQLQR